MVEDQGHIFGKDASSSLVAHGRLGIRVNRLFWSLENRRAVRVVQVRMCDHHPIPAFVFRPVESVVSELDQKVHLARTLLKTSDSNRHRDHLRKLARAISIQFPELSAHLFGAHGGLSKGPCGPGDTLPPELQAKPFSGELQRSIRR